MDTRWVVDRPWSAGNIFRQANSFHGDPDPQVQLKPFGVCSVIPFISVLPGFAFADMTRQADQSFTLLKNLGI